MAKTKVTYDGNTAATHVAYAFSEVAAIYPITPSSGMGELADSWAANGKKNIFGQEVQVSELQSEGGASGAVHGSLAAGALTTTFTASQGLLLMLPNMFKISAEFLPGVFHVSARSVATQALSIFGDHSDVMAARGTGFGLLASGSIQEVHDMALVAHLAAIESHLPFLHFFDGFRSSHEIQKIEVLDNDDYTELCNFESIERYKKRALHPEHPVTRGTAQNPDIFFQAREACNPFYDKLHEVVEASMEKVAKATGRKYRLFDYVGDPNAEHVVVAMGSGIEAIHETVEYLASKGEKVGLVKVRLYRPFVGDRLLEAIPQSVKKISVLDRTKEPGAMGEPLLEDVVMAFNGSDRNPRIIGGRYGLSSKEFNPSMINAIFKNMKESKPKHPFTVGINDDVTHLSLDYSEVINSEDPSVKRCKFWGLGADGTVGASKNSIKIIGDYTEQSVQGYFVYDSKKSGGITVSHLRFGPKEIRSTYLLNESDFVSCSNPSYIGRYDLLEGLKEGGVFLLNADWTADQVEANLPNSFKKELAEKKVKFYLIDAFKIGKETGLGLRINTAMQAAFFKLADVIPYSDAENYMKDAIKKTYGDKGEKIVNMNCDAVDKGAKDLLEVSVKSEWAGLTPEKKEVDPTLPEYIRDFTSVVNAFKGDTIPVSAFKGREDGSFEQGTSQYEKRGIATELPKWVHGNCIQCNQCAYVCPHAVIRPYLFKEENLKGADSSYVTLDAIGIKDPAGLKYRLQISALDCTGCGNCAEVCPGKKGEKALEMVAAPELMEQEIVNWNWTQKSTTEVNPLGTKNVKACQFNRPLFEFSGACAGCGETPYVKLITQLYGEQMIIANATGCSSIYGGTAPSQPYTVNEDGHGPAWANSLFEDNAEYGFGMRLAVDQIQNKLAMTVEEAIKKGVSGDLKDKLSDWLENRADFDASVKLAKQIKALVSKEAGSASGDLQVLLKEIETRAEYLAKKSVWIFGGDGWAYDIGYGGLDHVLAAGKDVNVLVMDTEVYSNTGGQSSKATTKGAIAKFAAAGKPIRKKELGLMMTEYGYVYVAQVSMGANKAQFLKAVKEAESYDGPSIIIAYSPCIAHGIKTGMGTTQKEMKDAVDCGYWNMFRYDPRVAQQGKNPFQYDGPKEVNGKFQDFLNGEVRFSSLKKLFPENAEKLFKEAEVEMKERFEKILKKAAE